MKSLRGHPAQSIWFAAILSLLGVAGARADDGGVRASDRRTAAAGKAHAVDETSAADKTLAANTTSDDPLAFNRDIRPLLSKHCFACHGEKKQENGVNFAAMTSIAAILNHRDAWQKAQVALHGEEMPPDPSETGFTAADRAKLSAWIHDKVETIDRASPIYLDPGPPLARQLTRAEYDNTLRDLLKVDFSVSDRAGIQSEEVVDGYDNLAGRQVIDEPLLEKYFSGADAALEWLFGDPNRNGHVKAAQEALLIARPGKDDKEPTPREAAKKVLDRLVRRAYRRPIESPEIDRLLVIFERAIKKGDAYEPALSKAIKPVLVSPHFLYRLERDPTQSGSTDACRVTDHELATRLSYFLWSTMPDDELARLADEGKLSDPDVLAAQIKRMLADGKASELTEHFAAQWLQLKRLDHALPERSYFPTFTGSLKNAMRQEMRMFFDGLRTEDRSILDLLDADYTFVNDELAKHYGLPDQKDNAAAKGDQMRKVSLRPEDHRGGLLGMGGMLTATSHTDRTKPTARGKWILEVVLGTPPAPPPPNVGALTPPKNRPEPKSVREKLALHASNATCAGCHKKIDPLGFALENYDAIGSWREKIGGDPVDNLGQLPGGKEFHGADDLKTVLRDRQPQIVRNMIVQVMTYALGRHVEYYDEAAIAQITDALAKDNYRFSTLIRGVVTSRPFLYRKSMGDGK